MGQKYKITNQLVKDSCIILYSRDSAVLSITLKVDLVYSVPGHHKQYQHPETEAATNSAISDYHYNYYLHLRLTHCDMLTCLL